MDIAEDGVEVDGLTSDNVIPLSGGERWSVGVKLDFSFDVVEILCKCGKDILVLSTQWVRGIDTIGSVPRQVGP